MLTPMPTPPMPFSETVLEAFVAVTVPPPVALNAVPLVVVRPSCPLNAIVAPVLLVRLIAFAVEVDAVIAPLKVYVPVLFEVTLTALAAVPLFVIVFENVTADPAVLMPVIDTAGLPFACEMVPP